MNEGGRTDGATPGDDESGLIPGSPTDRLARNAVELEAIANAYDKHLFRARRKKRGDAWLAEAYVRQVHRDMFGSIWDWAGQYRRVQLNIGVQWHQIPEQVRLLLDDFRYWNSFDSSMPELEIAARLQNRLTRIHLFKNGNGRHARLITDIFLYSRSHPLPNWPKIHLMEQGNAVRERYLSAMRAGDEENFEPLIAFIQDCLPPSP